MKRFIFLLAICSLTISSTIASDVGAKATTVLQKSSVITQITALPVLNAVCFEMTPVIYQASGVTLVNQPQMVVKSFTPDTWRNPDYGSSIILAVNNLDLRFMPENSNYSYTPYSMPNNYKLSTNSSQYQLPTARHVS